VFGLDSCNSLIINRLQEVGCPILARSLRKDGTPRQRVPLVLSLRNFFIAEVPH
jgi:hypothetical protein